MASTRATVADFRALTDAEVHHYATVALHALALRATKDIAAILLTEDARCNVAEIAELIEDEHGHCDTCGALCDARGCAADRSHAVAVEG